MTVSEGAEPEDLGRTSSFGEAQGARILRQSLWSSQSKRVVERDALLGDWRHHQGLV